MKCSVDTEHTFSPLHRFTSGFLLFFTFEFEISYKNLVIFKADFYYMLWNLLVAY